LAKPNKGEQHVRRYPATEAVEDWYCLTTVEAAPPYDWYMERVVAFVFRQNEHGKLTINGVTQGGEETHFAHFVRGDDRATEKLLWSELYEAGQPWFRPGTKEVTKLVPSIKGCEEEFMW
jgi:hypothetical protein